MNSSTSSAQFTRTQQAVWCALTLAVACTLAWLSAMQPVIPIEADHLMADYYEEGYIAGLDHALDWQGVWRILAFSLVGVSINLHPLAMPILALLTHAFAVYLFVATCSRLFGDLRLAVGLGILLAVWPLGYQALVWGACYTFVLAALAFWAQLWVSVRHGDRTDKQTSLFVLIALLTLAGALSNECLLGASLATGVWFWIRDRPSSPSTVLSNMKTYYAGWAPFAGAAIYVAAYYAFQPPHVAKQPGFFNPRSLLSAYYHTTAALAVFGSWMSPVMRDLGFDRWGPGAITLAIVLAALLLVLTWHGLRRLPAPSAGSANSFRIGVLIGCLLLGTSLIYAINGGFSPESRKLYPICFVMALAAAFVLSRLSVAWMARSAVILFVAACCVPTCWLLSGVWRFEAARNHLLARTLAENAIHSPIEVRSDLDPSTAWPYLFNSYGFRIDDIWLVDYTLAFMFPTHGGDLKHAAGQHPTVLRYERNKGWSIGGVAGGPSEPSP